jgi:hypothetical protein
MKIQMPRKTDFFRLRLLGSAAAIAVLALAPTGCKKKPQAPAAQAEAHPGAIAGASATPVKRHIGDGQNVSVDGGQSFANVTYAPTVKMFDHDEVRSSLQGITSDGHGWLFKNAEAGIKDLKAGEVFLVRGEMAGMVLGVVNNQDQTLLELGQASLKDVVASGQIKIDAPVRFHGQNQAEAPSVPFFYGMFDLIDPPVYAQSVETTIPNKAGKAGIKDAVVQSTTSIAGEVLSDWKVTEYSFAPGEGTCHFTIVMVKDVGGFVARVAAKGNFSDFDLTTNLDWTKAQAIGGKYLGPEISNSVKNMKGTIQFDWEIAKQSPGVWTTEDRVKLPSGISVPLAPLLGGMPLTLDVSSALLIHPALTGANEFSRGGFSISWGGGGSGGSFATTSSGVLTGGDQGGGNTNFTYQVTTDQNISPSAPNAMVISYCAPRIELRLDILGPFSDLADSAGGHIDNAASILAKYLPQSALNAEANSPLSKMTTSNVLSSDADVFVQFIATEGVTHSASVTPFPCSKQQIKFTDQGGIGARFFGLTGGALKTTDLFNKEFTRWDPASDFCKKV